MEHKFFTFEFLCILTKIRIFWNLYRVFKFGGAELWKNCLCNTKKIYVYMEKNGLNENVKILFRGFGDLPEDNFCKMRQWNILEHMFI